MKTVDIKKALRDGAKYSEREIDSGVEKAKRWMRAAYGAVDWDQLQAETGDAIGAVAAYCEETQQQPDGIRTFNRQSLRR